jgi:chitodextrinase
MWPDLSGLDNHATQAEPDQRPFLVAEGAHGGPAVRFDGQNDYLTLPDVMAGATQGEIFIVARLENFDNYYNGLAQFGQDNGVVYSEDGDGLMWEDFGTYPGAVFPGPGATVLTRTHVYHASVTEAGMSTVRFNGEVLHIRTTEAVAFSSTPLLGNDVYDEFFKGDIVEVLAYDRVLVAGEREMLYDYLASKYLPWTSDEEAPTAPADLVATELTSASFTLTWSPGEDNIALEGHEIWLGDVFYSFIPLPATSWVVGNLSPLTTYSVTVVARDLAGNRSVPGGPIEATTLVDETPPSTPGGLAAVGIGSTFFTLTWESSHDDVGVVAYDVYKDGVWAGSTASTSLALTGLTLDTTYEMTVAARDGAGNVSALSEPLVVTTVEIDAPPLPGLRLWLRADTGLPLSGPVEKWEDQSGWDNHAMEYYPPSQPTAVPAALNGFPVVRFDGDHRLNLPWNLMSGADAGEIIAVLRVGNKEAGPYEDKNNQIWNFGRGGGGYYHDNDPEWATCFHYEHFGLNENTAYDTDVPVSLVEDYHLYTVTSDGSRWAMYYNGELHGELENEPVIFSDQPTLGGDVFVGDFAEILIYDRSLSPAEREGVHVYLANKYALPGAPDPGPGPEPVVLPAPMLQADAVSSSSVDLSWSVPSGAYFTAMIERQAGSGTFTTIATLENQTVYTDDSLPPGSVYAYRVKLAGYGGESPYSSPAVVIMDGALSPTPSAGLRLWLRSTAGLPAAGPVAAWLDQSGQGNHAYQHSEFHRPLSVPSAVNGRPALRFNPEQGSYLELPPFMSGESAAEAFVVVRRDLSYTGVSGLWSFSAGDGSRYPEYDGRLRDSFASNKWTTPSAAPVNLGEFHVYNVGGDASHWFQNLNGALYLSRTGANVVTWSSTPLIGMGLNVGVPFAGDMVELLVYDRVLSYGERAALEQSLSAKYRIGLAPDLSPPTAPDPLAASELTARQATLRWGASSDDVGFVAYELYADGQFIAALEARAYTVTGLMPFTKYHFTVRARDAAGNYSLFSPECILTTPPPSVSGFVDSDGDGMPDAWEIASGLDPHFAGDADGDPDGDDLSNLDEYLAGADPVLPTTSDAANTMMLRIIRP